MKAQNLLDTTPIPAAKPQQIQGPTWPRWIEDPRKTYQMQLKAERLAQMRAIIMQGRQKNADAMHRVAYATHMERAVSEACQTVGVAFEWLAERSTLGNLKRGNGRSEKRAAVFAILRGKKYSFPEIALAFGTNASTVQTTLMIYAKRLTRPNNGA